MWLSLGESESTSKTLEGREEERDFGQQKQFKEVHHVPTVSHIKCVLGRVLGGKRGGWDQILKIFIIFREIQNNLPVVNDYQPPHSHFFFFFFLMATITFAPSSHGNSQYYENLQ